MNVRLTQLDGKLPNLALMKLSHWHRSRGDSVSFSRNAQRDMFEPEYGKVYGSTIFTRSLPIVHRFKREFPDAIIGGTGIADWTTIEQHLGVSEYDYHDYSIYPEFENSIGFSQRGCRLACGFCVVPRKEGKPKVSSSIEGIWRGEPWPKNIMLLDNDFFGQPRHQWMARLAEIRHGDFKVSFNQGINVRLITEESADELANLRFFDDSFKVRRLYTAFDNAGDEKVFRRGVDLLINAGINPDSLMVYMLVGYAQGETWDDVFKRFNIMRDYGVRPYPMVYQQVGEARTNNDLPYRELKDFQRWVIRRHYHLMPFADFQKSPEGRRRELHDESKLRLLSAVC